MIGVYLEARERGIINGQGLIVVKASLKKQWQKEVSKFSDYNANILRTYSDICSYQRTKIKKLENEISKTKPLSKERKELEAKRNEYIEIADNKFKSQFDNCDLLIANYETLVDEKVSKELVKRKIDIVMADEIHYAKTHTTDRSKALYKLNNAKIKVGATATPITKDPRDTYGIFKFVSPELFGKVTNFNNRYIKASYGKIQGFKNMDELKERIKDHVFLKTKEEISSQLPKLQVIPIRIEIDKLIERKTSEILEELDQLNNMDFEIRKGCKSEAEAALNEDLQKISSKILALQTFAQEIVNSPKLLTESDSEMAKSYAEGILNASNEKMEICIEKVSEIIESGEKVIIFSRYERMQGILTEEIHKKLGKNIKIAYINGSLSSEKRYEEAYTKFRDNDDYKVLLCSDAGAEGINASCCKYLIEYDLAVSYAIQTQRHGRLERADSIHQNVVVYQLIGENSWDEIQEAIVNKKKGFDEDIIKSLVN